MSIYQELCVDVLARTLWGEARNESTRGMEAVACVVQNRVEIARKHNGYWWGSDVMQVCQKPFQFSCWNANDPNRSKLMAVTDKNIHFATCLRIARRVVYGCIADITDGATHYHTLDVHPHWSEGREASAIIGHHIFFKLEE